MVFAVVNDDVTPGKHILIVCEKKKRFHISAGVSRWSVVNIYQMYFILLSGSRDCSGSPE